MNRNAVTAALSALTLLAAGCAGGSGAGSGLPASSTPAAHAAPKFHPSDTLGGVGDGPIGFALNILLGDAPPTIGGITAAQVNLGVDSISVVNNGQSISLGSYSTPNVVNVMADQGAPSSIGIGSVYNAPYQAISFTIDIASSNVVDTNGNVYPMSFSTAASLSSAGAGSTTTITNNGSSITMTVPGNFVVNGNPASAIQADFNAMESLNMGSNGTIVARPVLYSVASANAGQASGTLVNTNGTPVSGAVIALVDSSYNVQNTTATDANGNFNLHVVNAGSSYHLRIYNSYTTASGQLLTATGNTNTEPHFRGPSVTITAGTTTQLGTIAD